LAPAAAWAKANLVSSKDAVFSQAATTCGGIGQAACAITVQAAPCLDLTPSVQPILAVIGAVIAGEIAIWVPKAIAAFSARTGIILTAQQKDTVRGAVQTAAGMIETKLDQGALNHARVNVGDDAVRAEAAAAISAVPVAAAALGMTVDGVSRMIVGAVDTGSHGKPPVVAS